MREKKKKNNSGFAPAIRAGVFSLAITMLVTSAPRANAVEQVDVGVVFRFGPELNSPTAELYRGIEFAKDEFEKKNKFIKINLVKYSHTTDSASIEKAGKQIVQDKIKYVIGGEMSEEALTLGDQFKGQDLIFITPSASNPRVTEGRPNVFSACFSDLQVATELAKYALSLKNVKSVGVLHNVSNPYTDYLTTAFIKAYDALKDNQNTVKFSDFRYAGENPKFEGAVEKFKTENVDLVLAFTLEADLDGFYAAATKANFNPDYLGSDGWDTNEALYKKFITNQTNKSFKAVRNTYWHEESKNPGLRTFISEYQKKYGKKPDEWIAITYDSAMLLFNSIQKAKNKNDVKEVNQILSSTQFKDLATAENFHFDANHSPVKPLYLYEVSKDGIKFVKGVE
jgi:branched-chain amino acid transport system substrate-binding protein